MSVHNDGVLLQGLATRVRRVLDIEAEVHNTASHEAIRGIDRDIAEIQREMTSFVITRGVARRRNGQIAPSGIISQLAARLAELRSVRKAKIRELVATLTEEHDKLLREMESISYRLTDVGICEPERLVAFGLRAKAELAFKASQPPVRPPRR